MGREDEFEPRMGRIGRDREAALAQPTEKSEKDEQ